MRSSLSVYCTLAQLVLLLQLHPLVVSEDVPFTWTQKMLVDRDDTVYIRQSFANRCSTKLDKCIERVSVYTIMDTIYMLLHNNVFYTYTAILCLYTDCLTHPTVSKGTVPSPSISMKLTVAKWKHS